LAFSLENAILEFFVLSSAYPDIFCKIFSEASYIVGVYNWRGGGDILNLPMFGRSGNLPTPPATIIKE
jgi:hypothetical protein